jgi:hypothetical protein
MRTRTLLIAVAVAGVLVAAVAVAYWYSLPHYPWLFQGAYSVYEGNTTLLFIPVEFQARLQVMEYNTTHAKVFMLVNMTAFGFSSVNSTSVWFSLKDKNFTWPGSSFNQTYEGDYYIEGFGVRHCYVAENISPAGKVLIFIDSQTLWPIKLRFEALSAVSMDIYMVETNISGLK